MKQKAKLLVVPDSKTISKLFEVGMVLDVIGRIGENGVIVSHADESYVMVESKLEIQ